MNLNPKREERRKEKLITFPRKSGCGEGEQKDAQPDRVVNNIKFCEGIILQREALAEL